MLAFRSWRGVSDECGKRRVFRGRPSGRRLTGWDQRAFGWCGGALAGAARDGTAAMDDAVRDAGDVDGETL